MRPVPGEPEGGYLVLVNDEGQYSLWPTPAGVPEGWRVAHAGPSRQSCVDFIEGRWRDLLPGSAQR